MVVDTAGTEPSSGEQVISADVSELFNSIQHLMSQFVKDKFTNSPHGEEYYERYWTYVSEALKKVPTGNNFCQFLKDKIRAFGALHELPSLIKMQNSSFTTGYIFGTLNKRKLRYYNSPNFHQIVQSFQQK